MLTGKQQFAWKELARTRMQLEGEAIFARLAGQAGAKGKDGRIFTGYRPDQALAELVKSGWDSREAEAALAGAIIARFPAFANSWDNYIQQHGFLQDSGLLTDEDKSGLDKEHGFARLAGQLGQAKADPISAVTDWGLLTDIAARASKLNRRDERHPALVTLTRVHGLDRDLALAVLKHSVVVPWWAFPAFGCMGIAAFMVFLLAVFNPGSPVFDNESVGGVGILHYTALPLFALLFMSAIVWMIIDRPRREREWRQQLEKYKAARLSGRDNRD